MENEVTQDGNMEGSNDVAAVDTTVDQAGTDEAPVAPTEGSEPQADAPAEEGEVEQDFILDENGQKLYPEGKLNKIVQARLAKMAEQKNAAIRDTQEALRNDPVALKQFLADLGVEAPASADQKAEDPMESNAFDSFLASHVPAEHHAHYKALNESLSATIMPHVQALLEEKIGPMLQFIGKQEVKSFASQHPDYQKYSGKIQELVRSGRAKTLEDAYKLVAWEDKMKGAGAAAVKSEQERKSKLAGTPMRRSPGVPGASKPKYTNFREALERKAQQLGMTDL
jgi:hypothetical protein